MKTVIEMARKAGIEQVDQDVEEWICFTDELERFAELVRTDERARMAEQPAREPGRNHWEDGDVFERIGALAQQPAQQKPVSCVLSQQEMAEAAKRYTSPPQRTWVELTDEERKEIWKGCDPTHAGYVTALVEAKLKEKNT